MRHSDGSILQIRSEKFVPVLPNSVPSLRPGRVSCLHFRKSSVCVASCVNDCMGVGLCLSVYMPACLSSGNEVRGAEHEFCIRLPCPVFFLVPRLFKSIYVNFNV